MVKAIQIDGKKKKQRMNVSKQKRNLRNQIKKAEKERIKAEKKVEKERIKAEKERIKAEKERIKAEKERIKAEKKISDESKNKEDINNEIKNIQPDNSNESGSETKLIDGQVIELTEDFSGVVTRIDGIQYIITDGFPDDDEEDKEKIVWLASSLGEVESIGVYNGILVKFE